MDGWRESSERELFKEINEPAQEQNPLLKLPAPPKNLHLTTAPPEPRSCGPHLHASQAALDPTLQSCPNSGPVPPYANGLSLAPEMKPLYLTF